MSTVLVIAIIIVVIFIVGLVVSYNRFVTLRNRVDNAWSQIEVQMQRRLDLIPNVIEAVKGYATHEAETLQRVTDARTAYMSARTNAERAEAANRLEGSLSSLIAVGEAYPELKSSENYQQLVSELSETEDKVSYMRQSYNDTVMRYNTAIQSFPASLLAGLFGFRERELFMASPQAFSAPKVQL